MEDPSLLSREERNDLIKELMALKRRAVELPTLLKRIYDRIDAIENKLGIKIDVVTNKPGTQQNGDQVRLFPSLAPKPPAQPSSAFFSSNRYGADSHIDSRAAIDKMKAWKDLAGMDLEVMKTAYGQHVAATSKAAASQPTPEVDPAYGQPPSQSIIFSKAEMATPVSSITESATVASSVPTPMSLPNGYIKSLGPSAPAIHEMVAEEEKSKEANSGPKPLTNLDPGFKYPSYIYKGCVTPRERRRAKDKWQKLNPHLFPNRLSIHRRVAKFKALEETGLTIDNPQKNERLARLPSMPANGPTMNNTAWLERGSQTTPRSPFNRMQLQNTMYRQPLTNNFTGYTPGFKGVIGFPPGYYQRPLRPPQITSFFG